MSIPSPPFEDICKLFEKVIKAKSSNRKELFTNFFKKYQSNYGPSVFEPLRIFVPQHDYERKYNLKEDRLATILIKALVIDPHSADAQRLKQYKVPAANNPNPGNFSQNAFEEIKKRSTVYSSDMTLKDANNYLDKLADKNADQVEIFKEILSKFTATQVEWLIRIILKDLKIHCGDGTVLNAFHPEAGEAFSTHKNLRDIADPSYYTTITPGTRIKLFNLFVPQTAAPYSKKLFDQIPKPVYCELKLDGERCIMHYDREQDKFVWQSRKRNEVTNTDLYGSSSRDKHRLSGYIHNAIKPKRVILDGEMVAYDPETGLFLPFGTLKSVASENINPHQAHPCYVVFDILMVDNSLLVDYSFEERTKALKALIKEQGMFLKLAERKELDTEEQVMQELEEKYRNQEEGIMIKSKVDKYEINKRSTKWLKLKPDHVEGMRDKNDLLVVGAKYGAGRRGGKLASVMCAVRDDRIPDTEPPKFITFTLAGTGLSDDLMKELEGLMTNITVHDPKSNPPWLIHPTKGGETFDKILGYENSVVMEVLGSQIVESTKFGMQNTLRFPRCVQLRTGKSWQDVETYSQIMRAKAEGGSKRKSEEPQRAKTKARRTGGVMIESQKGLDSSNITQTSTIFAGKVFCVINGTKIDANDPHGLLKSHYDRLIKENGGEYIQNHKTADIVIAGVDNTATRSIISVVKVIDIIHPDYITDCIEAKRLLPITPKYMFYTSPATQAKFHETMDTFGDPYGKKTEAKDIMEVMERMESQEPKDKTYFRNLAKATTQRYFPEGLPGMTFLNTVAYFDIDTSKTPTQPTPITPEWVSWKRCQEELTLAQSLYEFEAGKVSRDISDSTITHIVLNKNDLSRFEKLIHSITRPTKPKFVVLDWIKKCYDQETLVNDEDYNPKYYNAQQKSIKK